MKVRRIDVLLPSGSGRTRVGSLFFRPERKFWRYQPRDRYRALGLDWQTVPEALTLPISDPDLRRLKRHLGRDVVYRETDRHPRAP